jgi:hypothetical protein
MTLCNESDKFYLSVLLKKTTYRIFISDNGYPLPIIRSDGEKLIRHLAKSRDPRVYDVSHRFSLPKIVSVAKTVQNHVHNVHNVHTIFTNAHPGLANVLFRSVHISLYCFVSCAFWNSTQSSHPGTPFSWDRIL